MKVKDISVHMILIGAVVMQFAFLRRRHRRFIFFRAWGIYRRIF